MELCPTEIWHEIFALACTDTGLTGRSLSLVSKQFNDISGPFKYQSLAITRWRQLVAFAEIFPQLPDSHKKIRYLFIHSPYPFMDVEDNPRIAGERPSLDTEACEIFEKDLSDIYRELFDSDSDSDYLVDDESESEVDSLGEEQMVSESDSESDSELGSLDHQEEEKEILDDVRYLRAVRMGSVPNEGRTREDESDVLDSSIQAVFDKAIQALHAILNETSSTLNILTLYWTSFKPLPIHKILPPLPFLDELHLFRCSIVEVTNYDDSSTTVLFPRLRLFFMSGDRHHRTLSCNKSIITPNITHFRFTRVKDEQ
jgi:hypothetical protein